MADARLRIVIDALNKAGDDLNKLKKDIDGVDDSAKKAEGSTGKFGGSLKSILGTATMVAAGVAAVGMALKQVYETAREGADLLYVEDRFDNLTDSIGSTSDVLMNDLREATRGLKSDAELMASATDFMSLGLAKSHDEVVRLTSVAGALGMNMNQLVLTLTNQTTQRFDTLGVAVDGFDEKVDALVESGMSAEDAFTEAFLQQAEEQIEKVGHAADSAAGSFDRMEASFANMSDSYKKRLAEDMAPALEKYADYLDTVVGFHNEMDSALERNIISEEEYKDALDDARHSANSKGETLEWVRERVIEYDAAIDTTAEDMIEYYINTKDAAAATEELGQVTIDASLAMTKYTEALLFKLASEGLDAEAALSLAEAMGLVDENTMYAASQMNTLRERFDAGLISAEQYEAAVVALGEEIEGLQDKTVTVDIKLIDPKNVRNWELRDQHATYTVNTVRTGDSDYQQRPTGGPVYEGNPYLWQEYGYRGELLVPSQNGFVLSRSDAERILSSAVSKGAGQQVVNNFNLTMPTTANPADMVTAFEIMEAYGA